MSFSTFSVQRRVSTVTTRLFNSAGVSNESSRTPHELTIGGRGGGGGYDGDRDDDVSEFSLRVTSIPPGEQERVPAWTIQGVLLQCGPGLG